MWLGFLQFVRRGSGKLASHVGVQSEPLLFLTNPPSELMTAIWLHTDGRFTGGRLSHD